MKCPRCGETVTAHDGYANQSYSCEACGYVVPMGAD